MALTQPTRFERNYWYFGVGGTLLVRTSTFDFSAAETGNDYTTGSIRFTNIGNHSIVSLWSDEVVRCLQEALGEMNWTRFYPIRTEFVWGYNYSALNDLRNRVVLIVEVPRAAVEFDEASAAALRCQTVLRIFNIMDVEVEVREINRQPYAMDNDLHDHVQKMDWRVSFPIAEVSYETFLPALSHIGYEITPEFEEPWRSGTMGMHVRLSDRPGEYYGLTCRHVAHRPTAGSNKYSRALWNWAFDGQTYVADKDSANHHRIVQMCSNNLERLQHEIKGGLRMADEEFRQLSLKGDKSSSDPQSYPALTEVEVQLHAQLKTHLPALEGINAALSNDHIEEADGRAIGHVAVMPPYEVSTKGFIRDWALIRLNEAKFNNTGGITNKVFVSNKAVLNLGSEVLRPDTLEKMKSFIKETRDDKGFIRLNGNIDAVPTHDRKSVGVGKRGAKSRLTFGVTNEIKAIVRVNEGTRLVAWEWIIVSLNPESPFSKPGDSGAVVFNSSGAIMAVITGGSKDGNTDRRLWKKHSDGGDLPDDPGEGRKIEPPMEDSKFGPYRTNTDLTFATPINFILDDIKLVTKSNVEII